MPYLLDTDILIDYLRQVPEALTLVDALIPDGVAVSVVTYMEAYEGTFRDVDPYSSAHRLDTLVNAAGLIEMDGLIARQCARIRYELRAQGRRINPRSLDLLVAGSAIVTGRTLVTRNLDDYRDIPGLTLYNLA